MKSLATILMCFLTLGLAAQTEVPDISEKLNDKNHFHYSATWDYWTTTPSGIKLEAFSRGFNASFVRDLVFGSSNFGITAGIGVTNNNYYHNAYVSKIRSQSGGDSAIGFTPIPDSINYKNNKLSLTFVEVPIEFRFKTKPNETGKSFRIAVGVKGGLLISTLWKYKGDDFLAGNKEELKLKVKSITHLSQYRVGPTFSVGYGSFHLYTFYSMTPFIRTNEGVEMNTMSIGLTFAIPKH